MAHIRGGLSHVPYNIHEENFTALIHPHGTIGDPHGTIGDPGLVHIETWPDPIERTRIDHWSWPWFPASSQYVYLSAWDGNQLPGFHKKPGENWPLEWLTPTSQYSQEYQRADRATTGMGQSETASILQSIKKAWGG